MSADEAPINIDADASKLFSDAIMKAISSASAQVEASGHALTLNALMGSLCAVAAFYIAGVDDARVRKSLMRVMGRDLPRLVAHQRSLETNKAGLSSRGKVVTVYQGGKAN